ncbi:hypothetical protein ACWCV9_36660 [Streptomyces sp. NPDC001606]
MAHLTDTGRTAYLAALAPGAAIDHRATTFSQTLLETLLRPWVTYRSSTFR